MSTRGNISTATVMIEFSREQISIFNSYAHVRQPTLSERCKFYSIESTIPLIVVIRLSMEKR